MRDTEWWMDRHGQPTGRESPHLGSGRRKTGPHFIGT